MAMIYRKDLDRPLNSSELDANFEYLEQLNNGNIPVASETVDGLLSKTDFAKLKSLKNYTAGQNITIDNKTGAISASGSSGAGGTGARLKLRLLPNFSVDSIVNDVLKNGNVIIAVKSNGIIETSLDNGNNWSRYQTQATGGLISISYGNGLYVASGTVGFIYFSSDGVNWNFTKNGTILYQGSIYYNNRWYVSTNSGDNIYCTASGSIDFSQLTAINVGTTVNVANPFAVVNDVLYCATAIGVLTVSKQHTVVHVEPTLNNYLVFCVSDNCTLFFHQSTNKILKNGEFTTDKNPLYQAKPLLVKNNKILMAINACSNACYYDIATNTYDLDNIITLPRSMSVFSAPNAYNCNNINLSSTEFLVRGDYRLYALSFA